MPVRAKHPWIFLYVMQCEEAVKVGVAIKPHQRLEQIQVSNPSLVTIESLWLAPRKTAFHIEFLMKEHLAYCHIRGEWFYSSPDVIEATIEHHDYVPESVRCQIERVPKQFTSHPQFLHNLLEGKELGRAPVRRPRTKLSTDVVVVR